MYEESENPFVGYIKEQIAHFGSEGMRLRDPKPLEDYKALVDTFFFVGRRLGTIEHELALHRLDEEFSLAWSEGWSAWKKIWRDFFEQRRDAIETENTLKSGNKESSKILTDLEKSYTEMDHKTEELRQSMRAVLDAFHAADAAGAKLSKGWRKGPWLLLWADLNIYTVYIRYFLARTGFFLFRHAFIFLTSILILGIAYSKVTGHLIQSAAGATSQWPLLAAILTILAYTLKKYYLDSKLKKLQIALGMV